MNFTSFWRYANKGLLVILGAFILAVIASIIFLSFTLLRLDTLMTLADQSSQSARLMQNLLVSAGSAETSVRGYVITSDTKYLGTYQKAVRQIPANIKALQTTPGVNASPDELKDLERNADEQTVLLKQIVAAKQAGGDAGSGDMASIERSSTLMDSLREQIHDIVDRSLQNAQPKYDAARTRVRIALSVAVAASVFVLGICIVLIWYFQRSILHERALESTKSEFLSLASHQLRTPATNVKQYIGLVLDGYLGNITKKQRNALEVAYQNNESEIRIMNDLLDVAKLDLKRIQLHKQRVNIVSIVQQVAKEYQQLAHVKGQTLNLLADGEVMANVDREYLKGVIEKLVDNAIRYSREKTHITVRVHTDEEAGMFEIVVQDQGLGIHKHEAPKLFMKFSRIANEFSANSEGSGLGLYWVKQIMELHGGAIEVRTREGRGSKFIVRAPLA